jgi:multisubunit Na+/H+ antiporter MnhB subunit
MPGGPVAGQAKQGGSMLAKKRWLWVVPLAVVLLGLYTWAFHDAFTTRVPGANDFYSPYGAAYLYFYEGVNPYSQQATLWIQHQLHGGPVSPGDITNDFVYPLYTILLVAPYTLFPTYAWVQAAWQVTLQVMLVASAILTVRYFNWRPPVWLLAAFIFWSILSYPSARAIILGQVSVVVFFLTVVTVWLLFRGEASPGGDVLAGVCLALSTVKPQMQFLIIPLLVLWGLRARRWTFLGAAALSLAALVGVSFLLLPTWLVDWGRQLQAYSAYTPPSVFYILTHEVLRLGAAAPAAIWTLRAVLGGYLLFEWWGVLRGMDARRLDWVLALTLVVTHLLAPRTATTHYVVLIFALAPLFRAWGRVHPLLPFGAMLLLFAGDWALFIGTVRGNAEADAMFLPLLLIAFVLVLLARPGEGQPGQRPLERPA